MSAIIHKLDGIAPEIKPLDPDNSSAVTIDWSVWLTSINRSTIDSSVWTASTGVVLSGDLVLTDKTTVNADVSAVPLNSYVRLTNRVTSGTQSQDASVVARVLEL